MSSISRCHSIIRTWGEDTRWLRAFEKKRRIFFFLHFRWRLAINQTVWYGSAAVYFIPAFCLYTKFLAFPPPIAFLCVCVCVCTRGERLLRRDQLHLYPKTKKARSTYSFLKYLTNSLMTTCSPSLLLAHPLYTVKEFSPAPSLYMSTYCLCIIFFFFLGTMDKVVKTWLLKQSKESKNGCQGCSLLCWSITVINTPVESKRLVDRHKRDWRPFFFLLCFLSCIFLPTGSFRLTRL